VINGTYYSFMKILCGSDGKERFDVVPTVNKDSVARYLVTNTGKLFNLEYADSSLVSFH
jgi:hypothetical protein